MQWGQVFCCAILLLSIIEQARCKGHVVILNDDNFDTKTAEGAWLIEIYAPWCSHCQQLEPTWNALAAELKSHKISVAKANGDENVGLMKRFGVAGFPSIYFLRDGKTWQYKEGRSFGKIKEFALTDYKKEKPMPLYKAPNSPVGRALGLLYRLPSVSKKGYRLLKDKGYSDMTIIAGVLLVPVAIGSIFICVLDAVYTRQPQLLDFDPHQHQE